LACRSALFSSSLLFLAQPQLLVPLLYFLRLILFPQLASTLKELLGRDLYEVQDVSL